MIIFTGTGRSGTQFYSKLFNTHHEYNVNKHLIKYFAYKPTPPDPFSDMEVRISIMKEHLNDVDLKSFRDSSNPYVHFLDALYTLDNDIRICLGVRDGRDFAISYISRCFYNEKKYYYFSVIPTQGDPYYEKWPQMTLLERCAWTWVFRNQKALDRLANVPQKNKHIIKLEQIRKPAVLSELEFFLGIKANKRLLNRKINATGYLKYPPKEDWTDEMNIRFYNIAGDMMARLGYPKLGEGQSLSEAKSKSIKKPPLIYRLIRRFYCSRFCRRY